MKTWKSFFSAKEVWKSLHSSNILSIYFFFKLSPEGDSAAAGATVTAGAALAPGAALADGAARTAGAAGAKFSHN